MPIRTVFRQLASRISNPLTPGELRHGSFWFSQLLMIVATVLGVFLASSEGMKVAIQFNELTRLERNYYLRESLANELEANTELVTEYADTLEAGISSYSHFEQNPLVLDQYVWQVMGESETTLETPSVYLSSAQQFYREVPSIYDRLADRTIGVQYGAEQLRQAAQRITTETVPGLRASASTLKRRLQQSGMDVD